MRNLPVFERVLRTLRLFYIQNPCSPDFAHLTLDAWAPTSKDKVTTLCFCIVTGSSTSFQIAWLPYIDDIEFLVWPLCHIGKEQRKIAGREIGLSVYIEQC